MALGLGGRDDCGKRIKPVIDSPILVCNSVHMDAIQYKGFYVVVKVKIEGTTRNEF